MSNIAMSNETDLDWLARNVHEWPVHVDAIHVGVGIKFGVMGWSVANIGFRNSSKITRHQWLARRAELQNKPSLADHPDAKCLVQHCSGQWWKNIETLDVEPGFEGFWKANNIGNGIWTYVCQGEVLGDWRDTLEKRPEKTRAEAEVDPVNAVAEAFNPITSIEDNQELNMTQQQEVKQDNVWFERGELPPSGIECEAKARGDAWKRVRTIGIDNEGAMVVQFLDDAIPYHGCTMPSRFRPIRTERELAIEQMCRDVDLHISVFELEAGKLYDAGYRKEPK